MKSMYKKGGKPTKKRESWMEESKEVHFGQMAKKKTGGSPIALYLNFVHILPEIPPTFFVLNNLPEAS